MRPAGPEPTDALLEAVLAGELDRLTREQIERLEARLARDASAERALAAARPPAVELPPEPLPSGQTWEAVWARIEQATPAGRSLYRAGRHAVWRAIVAAAACVMAMLAWGKLGAGPVLTVQLADDVTIESLEVGSGESAFVVYLDEGRGPPVVWVFDESAEGAGHVQ